MSRSRWLGFLIFCGFLGLSTQLLAAPSAELWPRWEAHNSSATAQIDHTPWDEFLSRFLDANTASGIHLMRYAQVDAASRQRLQRYLQQLQNTPISQFNRDEQMAFWINLYNARTVELILQEAPVSSITDISFSLFSFGPWGEELLTVENERLSLDDIEHRILRPIWRDPRIHYAVNCASLGCPNLQPKAFTAATLEAQLEQAAREFVNHPRGVRFEGEALILSKIYDWFQEDFGAHEADVLRHLVLYAEPELAERLRSFEGEIDYEYDWNLNEER
jgi:hypothetical protein